ncbi:Nif3-like dinuclear metal center hexameric protein [Glaciecola siphonariae]|uniref:Nif3-like dinuclear metal center hexameric protein n=1 Tax=Glaciecola siphonariae TaxID=521012 RepID=A0ABV9LRP3_9ALTE
MLREQLLNALNSILSPQSQRDYCPNGLQVEGKENIAHIVTGVTASQALIDKAVELSADALLVHHGYFWKNEDYPIVGIKKRRIATLLKHDINLIAYHLPLDVHETLGNNAQLGALLGLESITAVDNIAPTGIVMRGELATPLSHDELSERLFERLGRTVISVGSKQSIKSLAWCTGGGQGYIDQVAASRASSLPIDAFISGEISEQTTHSARELDLDFFAAGHHATERYGVKALGEYLAKHYNLQVTFVDVDNPA